MAHHAATGIVAESPQRRTDSEGARTWSEKPGAEAVKLVEARNVVLRFRQLPKKKRHSLINLLISITLLF